VKFLALFLICFNLYAFPTNPDLNKSPGKLCDPNSAEFTEYRYSEHIPYCARNVTDNRKNKIYLSYNIPLTDKKNYTIDHIIPLSIGGSNGDENLWPEHLTLKKARGTLEMDVYLGLKNGTMIQKDAVRIIKCSKFGNCK
jgi:hypothetical protein